MKIKVSNEIILILIIFITFLFGFPLRNTIFNGYFKFINVPYIFLVIIMTYINRKNLNIKKLLLLLFIVFSSIISDLLNGASLLRFFIYFFMTTFPIILLCINWDSVDIDIEKVKKVIKTYNCFIYLITIMYIIDLLTNGIIMRFIADNFVPYVKPWVNGQSIIGSRYATFLGQYLATNYIYIVFYFINTYFNTSINKQNQFCKQWIVNIISIIGVLSSGSKVGFIILAISLIVFNIKNIMSMIMLCITLLSAYHLGAFNLLFNRIQNESVSTGRFEAWDVFLSSNLYKPHFFYGLGDCFNMIISNSLGNFITEVVQELPFIILIYKNGIFSTIIMLLFLCFFPIIYKGNSFYTRFSIISIFLIINSYNGLLVNPDTLMLYLFALVVIFLITNLKKIEPKLYLNKKKDDKNENSYNDMV